MLAAANPALAGLKPRRWIGAKSDASRGLRDLGMEVAASRDEAAISPAWAALHAQLPDRKLQIGLSKLLRFSSRQGIEPSSIDLTAFESFREELVSRSLHPNAEAAYRQATQHWNRAARELSAWPQVTVPAPRDPRRYSFEWEEFPGLFVAEVHSFLTAKSESDPLSDDYSRPTRMRTTESRRKSLRQLASALVLSGQLSIDQLTSLAVLTEIENVRAALRYLRDHRAKGEVTEGHVNHAWLLRTIARYWVKDEALTAKIKTLIANLSTHNGRSAARGITPKNRERLRQFDLPENVEALIWLPERVLRSVARKSEPTYQDAVRVMYALQIGMLTFVPMRSRNLTELKLETNLIDVGKRSKRTVVVHLPAAITKTYRDYQAPLPKHLFPLLDAWLKRYRGRVCDRPSPYLFPNPSGELRSRDSLSAKLTRFVERETGLTVNVHLFRHIAAKVYLDCDPSGIEVVRQLLGHTSTRTTMRVYAELQTDPAFHRLEAAMFGVGSALPTNGRAKRLGSSPS